MASLQEMIDARRASDTSLASMIARKQAESPAEPAPVPTMAEGGEWLGPRVEIAQTIDDWRERLVERPTDIIKWREQSGLDYDEIFDAYDVVDNDPQGIGPVRKERVKKEIDRRRYKGFFDELDIALARGGERAFAGLLGTFAQMQQANMPGGWYPHTPEIEAAQKRAAQQKEQWAQRLYDDAQSYSMQPAKGGGFRGFVANTLGDTLAYMSLSAVAGAATGPVGAFGVAAAIEGDNAYRDAIADGATEEQAQFERLIVGTINGAIELAQVGQILRLGKRATATVMKEFTDEVVESTLKKFARATGKLTTAQVTNAINEGLEEVAQEWVSMGTAVIVHGKELTPQEIEQRTLQAGAGGATAGFLLGAGSVVLHGTMEQQIVEEPGRKIPYEGEEKPLRTLDEAAEARGLKEFPEGQRPPMVMTEEQHEQYEADIEAEARLAQEREQAVTTKKKEPWEQRHDAAITGGGKADLAKPLRGGLFWGIQQTPEGFFLTAEHTFPDGHDEPVEVMRIGGEAAKLLHEASLEEQGGNLAEASRLQKEAKQIAYDTFQAQREQAITEAEKKEGEKPVAEKPKQTPEDAARAARIFQMYQETGDEALLEDLPPGAKITMRPEEVSDALAKTLETPEQRQKFKANIVEALQEAEGDEELMDDLSREIAAYQRTWGETDPIAPGLLKYMGMEDLVVEQPQPPAPAAAKEPWEMTREEFAGTASVSRSTNYIAVKSPHGGDFIIRSLETSKYTDEAAIELSRRDYIKTAVEQGKPVPAAVLREYQGEPWADAALRKAELAKGEGEEEAWDKKSIAEQLEAVGADEKIRQHPKFAQLKEKVDKAWKRSQGQDIFSDEPNAYLTQDIAKGVDDLQKQIARDVGLHLEKDTTGLLGGWTIAVPKPKFSAQGQAEPKPPAQPGAEPGGGVPLSGEMGAIKRGLEQSQTARRQKRVRAKQRMARGERIKNWEKKSEQYVKEGMRPQDAMGRAMAEELSGELTEYQLYTPLGEYVPQNIIDAAYEDIRTTENLRGYERISTRKAFYKLEKGLVLAPFEARLIKKWRPELWPIAEARVPWSVWLFTGIEQALGLAKLGAAFDIQMRRQARWMRARHPQLYTQAVIKNVEAYVSQKRGDKLAQEVEDSPNHQDAIDHGVQFLERHGKTAAERPEQYISYLGERIPLFGKVYAASMRGFVDSFNWLQQALWDHTIDTWDRQGFVPTDQDLDNLAEFQNTFLGMKPATTNFGRALRRVLRPVVWSPTLTWSRIRTPSMIFTNKTMRGETAVTLAGFIGTGIMFMAAASLIARWLDREDPVEWDRRSTDFGKIRIGDTRVDVFGDGGPYIRALIQFVEGEKKNQAGRIVDRPRLEAIKQFARNKRAPWIELVSKVWTGRNYYGGPAWALPDWAELKEEGGVKTLVAKAGEKLTETKPGEVSYLIGKEVGTTAIAYFIQATLEASWHDGWIVGLLGGAEELFSGQVLSYEPSAYTKMQMLQDEAAVAKYNELWEDLSPNQQRQLRRQVPEIDGLEEEAAAERLPKEEFDLREQNQTAARIRKALSSENRAKIEHHGISTAISRQWGDFWLNDERYKEYEALTILYLDRYLARAKDNTRPIQQAVNKAREHARYDLRRAIERNEI